MGILLTTQIGMIAFSAKRIADKRGKPGYDPASPWIFVPLVFGAVVIAASWIFVAAYGDAWITADFAWLPIFFAVLATGIGAYMVWGLLKFTGTD